MDKLLTVSIAAYNVEDYIRQCIESCLVPEVMDRLEVLVIDDGATDNTGKIADEYQEKYPGIVRVIHKENGGYGTTVNIGMREATGKYFKVLDGDDWFDRDGLIKVVEHLETAEADIIVAGMRKMSPEGEIKKAPRIWEKYCGSVVSLSNIKPEFSLGHYELILRVGLLRKHPFQLPGKILYTDTLYASYPLYFAETLDFLDNRVKLYCYRVGRDGQSVSTDSQKKHWMDQYEVVKIMLDVYCEHSSQGRGNLLLVQRRIAVTYSYLVKTQLLFPASRERRQQIITFEKELRERSKDIYNMLRFSRLIRVLRTTGYLAYWPIALKGIKNWITN